MTARVVSPLVPPPIAFEQREGRQPARTRARRPLPVARLAPARDRSAVYGLAAIDCRGRVADTAITRALGWVPGIRLDVRECGGLILVTADRQGVFGTTRQGHVRLPTAVRRWCGLTAGDRVLLVADASEGLLVVYPPAALDAMTAQFHAGVLGGGAA